MEYKRDMENLFILPDLLVCETVLAIFPSTADFVTNINSSDYRSVIRATLSV